MMIVLERPELKISAGSLTGHRELDIAWDRRDPDRRRIPGDAMRRLRAPPRAIGGLADKC